MCKVGTYTLLSYSILLPRITPITQSNSIQSDVIFCFNRLPLSHIHVHKIFKCYFRWAGAARKRWAHKGDFHAISHYCWYWLSPSWPSLVIKWPWLSCLPQRTQVLALVLNGENAEAAEQQWARCTQLPSAQVKILLAPKWQGPVIYTLLSSS